MSNFERDKLDDYINGLIGTKRATESDKYIIAANEKANNKDLESFRIQKLREVINTEAHKNILKENGIKRKNNPLLKEKQSKLLSELNYNDDFKSKRISAMKKSWQSDELKKKQSENTKKQLLNPETIKRRAEAAKRKQIPNMTPDGMFEGIIPTAEFYSKKWNVKLETAIGKIRKYFKEDPKNWFQLK